MERNYYNELSQENREKIDGILEGYAGSDGIEGRFNEMYEEGFKESDSKSIEDYVSANEYAEYLIEQESYRD